MDDIDTQLLCRLQDAVPLTPRPWRAVGEAMGLAEDDILRRTRAMRAAGVIRRIGGVFDAARLGYRQTLLAFRVADDALDRAAEPVREHPGVSHCYGRADEYNLWATLAVSPDSTLGLERTAEILADRAQAKSYLPLPARKRFKLAVCIGGEGGATGEARPQRDGCDGRAFPEAHRQAVRALQRELPLIEEPFESTARLAGADSVEALFALAEEFLASGVLRRYAAVAHHVLAGARANVLVAWCVPQEQEDRAGDAVVACRAVSHGYLRESRPDWPYNLYTMIHGRSREECLAAVEALARSLPNTQRRELWTTNEYKKTPTPLFSNDEAVWESDAKRATPRISPT